MPKQKQTKKLTNEKKNRKQIFIHYFLFKKYFLCEFYFSDRNTFLADYVLQFGVLNCQLIVPFK